jgi:hypothetical protein
VAVVRGLAERVPGVVQVVNRVESDVPNGR